MIRKMNCLIAILLLFLTGCYNTVPIEAIDLDQQTMKVGLLFDSFVIERWQRDRDTFVSQIKQRNGEVYVQNANGDAQKQIDQMEYFIAERMDAIVIVSTDQAVLAESVKKAQLAGIIVIAYDRPIQNANVDLLISFDNEKVGQLMAESIRSQIGETGTIAVIFGSPADGNVSQVEQGFQKGLAGSQIQILDQQYAPSWLAEVGFQTVTSDLQMGMQFDAICCGNDDIASQVIKALSEHRLAGEVWVVGQDAELSACQRIVEGTQGMTVYKPVTQAAWLAAESVYTLIQEGQIETAETFFDGTYEVPFIRLAPVAVTKENMDEVIIGGNYHLKEEIYLNTKR